jgi:hypothetical protein
LTTGVGGYRGQEQDMIPVLRMAGTKGRITQGQIWLATHNMPRKDGLTYYNLGGNHDYWHVINSGIDAVAEISRQRDDMIYLGYDVADLPLTDKVDVRLFHPTGGVPYALSYRLQKSLEQMAFDELTRAIVENDNPKMRLLIAGHLHVEVKFQRGPMVAVHPGCFEGQTNYLKRKGLYPSIGGSIFRIRLSDGGLVTRCEYTFIPFVEIENDWSNWPVPDVTTVLEEPMPVNALFSVPLEREYYSADARPA